MDNTGRFLDSEVIGSVRAHNALGRRMINTALHVVVFLKDWHPAYDLRLVREKLIHGSQKGCWMWTLSGGPC